MRFDMVASYGFVGRRWIGEMGSVVKACNDSHGGDFRAERRESSQGLT